MQHIFRAIGMAFVVFIGITAGTMGFSAVALAHSESSGPSSNQGPGNNNEAADLGMCVPDPKHHLEGEIDQETGNATIMNLSGACTYQVGLAVYEIGEHNKQTLFDSHIVAELGPYQKAELKVDLPDCRHQIDLFYGDIILDFQDGKNVYGERLLDGEKGSHGREVCQDKNNEVRKIAGRKYEDLNKNGVFDNEDFALEPTLEGWKITLQYPDGTMKTSVTGENGYFEFNENIVTGKYHLCEEKRDDWMQTQPGNAAGCHTITLAEGAMREWRNFGNVKKLNENPPLSPMLAIEKTADKDSVELGGQVTYTITLKNEGNTAALHVLVTDYLPEGFKDVLGQSILVWSIDKLEAGQKWEKTFVASVDVDSETGVKTNTVVAKAENHPEVKVSLDIKVKQRDTLPDTGVNSGQILLWMGAGLAFAGGIRGMRGALAKRNI